MKSKLLLYLILVTGVGSVNAEREAQKKLAAYKKVVVDREGYDEVRIVIDNKELSVTRVMSNDEGCVVILQFGNSFDVKQNIKNKHELLERKLKNKRERLIRKFKNKSEQLNRKLKNKSERLNRKLENKSGLQKVFMEMEIDYINQIKESEKQLKIDLAKLDEHLK